jgi:hypothetical protein
MTNFIVPKVKVKDKPRFKLIEYYEKEFKEEYATIFSFIMEEIKKRVES